MIKGLIDSYFANHYGLGRLVLIEEAQTAEKRFDLMDDDGAKIVDYGNGYASFDNDNENEIAVLDYEGYIDKYTGTKFYNGRGKCDCIIESEVGKTLILDEITSSTSGIENLTKPINGRKKYEGGKFEKVEHQLHDSLQTLIEVPEIASYVNTLSKKICLCSYTLYSSDVMSLIGDPVSAFNLGQKEVERQVGENGAKISCPPIEALGFEFRRISHSFTFSI